MSKTIASLVEHYGRIKEEATTQAAIAERMSILHDDDDAGDQWRDVMDACESVANESSWVGDVLAYPTASDNEILQACVKLLHATLWAKNSLFEIVGSERSRQALVLTTKSNEGAGEG